MRKKEQIRKDLFEQIQQKELIRKHDNELKQIESISFKKLNEELEELEKKRKLYFTVYTTNND